MSDNTDDVVVIPETTETIVVLVEDLPDTVLIIDNQEPVVVMVHEGPPGPPGDVPEWVEQTSITVSNTAPQNPRIGDLWVDTN